MVFSSILNWIMGGTIAVLLASGMWIVHDYKSQATQIATLQAQLKVAKSASKVAAANNDLSNETIATLNDRLTTRYGDLAKACALYQDIAKDKAPEADAPVGGILGDILGKIDGSAPKTDHPPLDVK